MKEKAMRVGRYLPEKPDTSPTTVLERRDIPQKHGFCKHFFRSPEAPRKGEGRGRDGCREQPGQYLPCLCRRGNAEKKKLRLFLYGKRRSVNEKKQAASKRFEEFDDDDFDDFGEEADFEEEYDEVDYEEDYGYDNDGDESEELIDDLDELLSSQPSKKRGHMEEDDTFKVDFIDLD